MNDLARIARATNQAEAESVQALLLEVGIASMLRRSPGFDVPDMLAAGPRDAMVPSAAHDAAREILLQAEIVTDDRAVVDPPMRRRLPARALRTLLEAMRIYPPRPGSLSRGCPRVGAATTSDGLSGRQAEAMRVDQRPPDDPGRRRAATAPRAAASTRSARRPGEGVDERGELGGGVEGAVFALAAT